MYLEEQTSFKTSRSGLEARVRLLDELIRLMELRLDALEKEVSRLARARGTIKSEVSINNVEPIIYGWRGLGRHDIRASLYGRRREEKLDTIVFAAANTQGEEVS